MRPTADLLRTMFRERFGREPKVVVRAPGRVNLIGEHTDTSEGFVMPAAIDRGTWVAASLAAGPTELTSREQGAGTVFDAATVEPGQVDGWAQYAAGVAWALRQQGFEDLPNLQGVVVSDLPIGAGLSSSAALEVGFLHAWNALRGLHLTGLEIAVLARAAENRFVGVGCGIMDPLASVLGRAGCAMKVDTCNLEVAYSTLSPDWQLVVCDTGTPRTLAGSAYNQRRWEVERAAQILGVPSLRGATLIALEQAAADLPDPLFRRARHVLTENERVHAFAAALDARDRDGVAATMRASHLSLRDDFEASSAALDAMAEAAWAAPGCLGARMTGAGFGGACIALVESEQVAAFCEETAKGYRARLGRLGTFLQVSTADGAGVLGGGPPPR